MEVDDGDQFEADFLSRLHDNASSAGGGTDQKGLCAKCGCETAGNKKCNLCDIVHVLWHGDRLWKEPQPKLFLSNHSFHHRSLV